MTLLSWLDAITMPIGTTISIMKNVFDELECRIKNFQRKSFPSLVQHNNVEVQPGLKQEKMTS